MPDSTTHCAAHTSGLAKQFYRFAMHDSISADIAEWLTGLPTVPINVVQKPFRMGNVSEEAFVRPHCSLQTINKISGKLT